MSSVYNAIIECASNTNNTEAINNDISKYIKYTYSIVATNSNVKSNVLFKIAINCSTFFVSE